MQDGVLAVVLRHPAHHLAHLAGFFAHGHAVQEFRREEGFVEHLQRGADFLSPAHHGSGGARVLLVRQVRAGLQAAVKGFVGPHARLVGHAQGNGEAVQGEVAVRLGQAGNVQAERLELALDLVVVPRDEVEEDQAAEEAEAQHQDQDRAEDAELVHAQRIERPTDELEDQRQQGHHRYGGAVAHDRPHRGLHEGPAGVLLALEVAFQLLEDFRLLAGLLADDGQLAEDDRELRGLGVQRVFQRVAFAERLRHLPGHGSQLQVPTLGLLLQHLHGR